jgi:tRNA pseudouridine38-40 synthase
MGKGASAPRYKKRIGDKPDQEPDPKSRALNGEESSASTREFSKKKVALVLGYLGTAYQGFQIQPNAVTLEDVLEKAIVKAGGISADNAGNLTKVSWSRAARTDKGVHAFGNVVSLKMNPNTTVDQINSHLPDDFRVLDKIKVTKSFHSKQMCSSRVYEYLLPSFLLENDLKIGSEEEFRAKYPLPPPDAPEASHHEYLSLLKSFKASNDAIEELNGILRLYEGTNNFHNFTTRRAPTDASCKRYIKSFSVLEPVDIQGVQFLRLNVHGSSFMLHQIRRMVGGAIAVHRGKISRDLLSKNGLFSLRKFGIPTAPSLGLYLLRCVFDTYNSKLEKIGGSDRIPLDLSKLNASAAEFRLGRIYPEILRQELASRSFYEWTATSIYGRTSWDFWDAEQGDCDQAPQDEELGEDDE